MKSKRKQIDDLNSKIEEIIRINEELRLENAEVRAKIITLSENEGEVKISSVQNQEETQVLNDGYDSLDNDKIEVIDSINLMNETDDSALSNEKAFDDDEQFLIDTINRDNERSDSESDEIEDLKKQNRKILAEMEDIKELLRHDMKSKPVISEQSVQYPAFSENIGKIIVDSQAGAAKIIEEAKKEAIRHLQEAKNELSILRERTEEKNYKVAKKLDGAKKNINEIMDRMEELSEDISAVKKTVVSEDLKK